MRSPRAFMARRVSGVTLVPVIGLTIAGEGGLDKGKLRERQLMDRMDSMDRITGSPYSHEPTRKMGPSPRPSPLRKGRGGRHPISPIAAVVCVRFDYLACLSQVEGNTTST